LQPNLDDPNNPSGGIKIANPPTVVADPRLAGSYVVEQLKKASVEIERKNREISSLRSKNVNLESQIADNKKKVS
jgi:hypothetical protein